MQKELLHWYQANKRDLPWRKSRNPYRIWISEVMLQQTTVAAVIPFYERFMRRFPDVKSLAQADESDVLEMWAGLGYYSRARNLHLAAQKLAQDGFPQTAEDLLKLPGFGPYTSRAVASLAFDERVGVLDGNVIRILARVYGLKLNWWLPKERNKLQKLADEIADSPANADLNQAMMELGATVCTPKKPLCLLCPWKKQCVALKKNQISELPGAKPKAIGEIWLWEMEVITKNQQILLKPNDFTPFLPGLMFPPGQAKKLKNKPSDYDLKHGVTKYDIFIKLKKSRPRKIAKAEWIEIDQIKKINPTSLMMKILKKSDIYDNI